MFSEISITAFIIVVVGIILHYVISRPKSDDSEQQCICISILRKLVFLLTLFLFEQKLNIVGILRKLVYLLALLCFLILVVTGFFPLLVLGKHISGYWIMLHTTAAGVFAVCLAVLSVMWVHNCQFDKNYWPWLQRLLQRVPLSKDRGQKYELGQKICFWLIVLLALPVILSIVLTMFPFFGTDWQKILLSLHRYSALSLALTIVVHTYLMIQSQV
jgi:cytochrome b subunit of formate dehydrogenase